MSIFRAYDIRGVFGRDLTEEIAEKIGKGFGTYIKGKEVVVGRDCRLSSSALSSALIRGLTSVGCDVTDIGMVPTPVVYFSMIHYKKNNAVMITGSHNPPEYNGFKLCKDSYALYGDEIQEIRKILESGNFIEGSGTVTRKDVTNDYVNFIKERISLRRRLKIVIDAGNGTGGEISERIFRELGCDVIPLYCEPDGSFPNHHPDPTIDEFLNDLIETVKRERADIGIAYDGDADRVGFIDDKGRIIRGDQSLILFSREILRKHKGSKIIFEVKCSQAVIEDIERNGGIPIMYRTGHSFIKKKMKEENALLAGEMSGHFFFADNYYGYDDAIFASARMAELLSRSEKNLSEIISDIPRYISTPEIRIRCRDDEKFRIVESIVEKFKREYSVITVDGARIQFKDGWGLVRASNTEPALILRFEAKTKEELNRIEQIITDELRRFPSISGELNVLGQGIMNS